MAPLRKRHNKLFLIILLPILLLLQIQSVHASVLDDLFKDIKNFINPGKLAIDSVISLAAGGDVESNGEIDAGDTLRFSYTITNLSDKKYAFATIKTNIDRKQLNFVHNVQGSSGLTDDGKTITFPNIRLEPSQILTINFDARINYFQDSDKTISTESEFIENGKDLIAKSQKKEVNAKKLSPEKIESLTTIKQQKSE